MSIFFFFLLLPSAYLQETKPGKNILILYAMAPSTPAYQVISDGIRSKLTEAFGDGVSLHMEYLETERYPDGNYPKERFEPINWKYEKIDIDMLICVGVNIISTVKRCANQKLLNLPAITIEYDVAEFGFPLDLRLNDKNAIIGIKPNIRGTLRSALDLFPDRNHLYILCGTSKTDLMYLKITAAVVSQLDKNLKISYIDQISMDDALSIMSNLPDSSLVFIPGFNTDNKKVFYYNPEAIRLISQASKAPVFTMSDMGFGEGAVGGYILSFRKTGLLAGDIAAKILKGLDPNSIKVVESDYFDYIYDWRQLKKWGALNIRQLPKNSIIEFEEITFFDKYKLFIIAILIFLVFQTLMILNLVRMNRRQKLITAQLIETQGRYRELIREDRILRIGQMTASLSHELNQPLTAILSTAQAGIRILDSGKNDQELLKEIFRNIVEDDKRTASILSSLRGMMKLEKREKEKVDLNELIREIVEIYRSEAIAKASGIIAVLPEKPVFIYADRIQIQQVIMNLLSNALQSVEKADKRDSNIEIIETDTVEYVIVSVRDHGPGIDPSMKEKLFKPFTTTKKEGFGIGLAISQSIIYDHQGKIWAENLPGGGAVFSFSLKIYRDE